MKKFLSIIAFAMLILTTASCTKDDSKDYPPYWQIAKTVQWSGGTEGYADFSKISAVVDQYANVRFDTESQAVAAYNDILSKTKDVEYTALTESFYKLYIAKYVSKKEDEHTVSYDIDPSYKSPVGHIWDAKGSRDL